MVAHFGVWYKVRIKHESVQREQDSCFIKEFQCVAAFLRFEIADVDEDCFALVHKRYDLD